MRQMVALGATPVLPCAATPAHREASLTLETLLVVRWSARLLLRPARAATLKVALPALKCVLIISDVFQSF